MLSDIVYLCVVALLTALAALFAATDAALATVSVARIDDLLKDGRAGARRLRVVVDQRATYVSLAVLLRVLCEIAATALVAVLTVNAFGTGWGIGITVVAMTIVSFVAVGVGPRTLGRQNAYSISLVAAPILTAVGVLLRPVTRVLIITGNALTPGKGYRNGPFATEVEVREVVDMAQEHGIVEPYERRMIQSVFEFGDTDAREVMVPRPEMIWIENDKSAAQAMSLAVRSGHSRIPVIGENPDDVLGVVYLKDVVERLLPQLSSAASGITVDAVMREPEFVPDSKPLDDVLADMQAKRNHMALLVDEYGGIAGLVTIEDVLEEIVGEISDEYDTDEIAPIEEISDGVYRVSSRLPVEDLEELFDVEIDLDLDDVDTVGGLLALRLGRVPLPGAKVKVDGLRMTAEGGPNRLGRQRITSVVVRRTKKAAAAVEAADVEKEPDDA
ncbi:hemolysin family protein [Gordonia hydrophobica]|uniref:Hemolysin family protein n=1 Tax=Gordonia hydrophobica TaxID=40516 RepID=A0ABZ2TXZ1_9ACTN|nr:hemolysin family protein [Gordonia hydrophobica]MBM7366512.1 CBS domain containing-hemolysin-like protein [Gordonia hydrophobica]